VGERKRLRDELAEHDREEAQQRRHDDQRKKSGVWRKDRDVQQGNP
jgi:hypothetical protein